MRRGDGGCTANGLLILVLLGAIGAIVAWAILRPPEGPPVTGPAPEKLGPADSAPPMRTPR